MQEENNDGWSYKTSSQIFHKHQIIINAMEFIGLIYLVFGIFVAFAVVFFRLDMKTDIEIKMKFFDPISSFYFFVNLIIFILIIYHRYNGERESCSYSTKLSDNHMIVYCILAPLFLLASIKVIVEIIRDIMIIPCNGYLPCLIPLSSLLLFIGSFVVILDLQRNEFISNNWKAKLLETSVIFFTVIGFVNGLIINLTYQHIEIFIDECNSTHYCKVFKGHNSCILLQEVKRNMNEIYHNFDTYLQSTVLLFCICGFIHLIQMLFHKMKEIDSLDFHSLFHNSFSLNLNELDNQYNSLSSEAIETESQNELILKIKEKEENPSFRLPSASLVVCIIFLSLSILTVFIRIGLNTKTKNQKIIFVRSIIVTLFPIINYLLGIGLTLIYIIEIGRWPVLLNRRSKIIDKYIIWIGAAGQIYVALVIISFFIESIKKTNELAIFILLILRNILLIIQVVLQTILINLTMNKKWIQPNINSWSEYLCPSLGMMGLNIGMLIITICEMVQEVYDEKKISYLFILLFLRESRSFAETLSGIQRFHAAMFFANMVAYTHN